MPIIVESGKTFGSLSTSSMSLDNMSDRDRSLLQHINNLNVSGLRDYVLTSEDKKRVLTAHRRQFGNAFGFDGAKMFMADQDSFKKSNLQHGSSFEITRDYVEANPKGWSDIPEDILVIKKDVPGVVIGHAVADCPVVMLIDKKQGISAIAHCGAAMIDAHLPEMIAEALLSSYGSRAEDIYAYISACAGDSWTYDGFPQWATDMGIWDRMIYQGTDNKFHINIRPAILEQLLKYGVSKGNISFNPDDTITSNGYYSNSAYSPKGGNDPSKFGRNFAGLFYPENDEGKITIRGPHK